ncbi:MAG: hypothetical protein NZ730_06845 [Porticoccaceae bacterium]|nr:hypothetical protein [Porticoccaceae bacterium]
MIHKWLQVIVFISLIVGCASQPSSYANFTKMSVDEVSRWPAEQICRWKAQKDRDAHARFMKEFRADWPPH